MRPNLFRRALDVVGRESRRKLVAPPAVGAGDDTDRGALGAKTHAVSAVELLLEQGGDVGSPLWNGLRR